MMLFGIEAGGTKFILGAGSAPNHILERVRIPTEHPSVTIPAVIEAMQGLADRHVRPDAIGIASFGPVEIRIDHQQWGHLLATPKQEWVGVNLVGPIADVYAVPLALDTDVNGAALAEGAYGAGKDVSNLVYLTFGTGVGGGLVVGGGTIRGAGHPEMGHIRVPRHPDDDFPGVCPYHGDCLEGMASGPAIETRWGKPANELDSKLEPVLELEAHYIAHALANIVYVVAPERFVLGGGVSNLPGFHRAISERLAELLSGYPGIPHHAAESFVVAPGLGEDAGLTGALMLAASVR
ncbi:MAG: ROK family protein [Acidimicrobiia bacterium]|nr:ROK family protein [Acidimicrobiia bacterium]